MPLIAVPFLVCLYLHLLILSRVQTLNTVLLVAIPLMTISLLILLLSWLIGDILFIKDYQLLLSSHFLPLCKWRIFSLTIIFKATTFFITSSSSSIQSIGNLLLLNILLTILDSASMMVPSNVFASFPYNSIPTCTIAFYFFLHTNLIQLLLLSPLLRSASLFNAVPEVKNYCSKPIMNVFRLTLNTSFFLLTLSRLFTKNLSNYHLLTVILTFFWPLLLSRLLLAE